MSLALAILLVAQAFTLTAVIFLACILVCAGMTSCGIHLEYGNTHSAWLSV
jgi:hypothetical protein